MAIVLTCVNFDQYTEYGYSILRIIPSMIFCQRLIENFHIRFFRQYIFWTKRVTTNIDNKSDEEYSDNVL